MKQAKRTPQADILLIVFTTLIKQVSMMEVILENETGYKKKKRKRFWTPILLNFMACEQASQVIE